MIVLDFIIRNRDRHFCSEFSAALEDNVTATDTPSACDLVEEEQMEASSAVAISASLSINWGFTLDSACPPSMWFKAMRMLSQLDSRTTTGGAEHFVPTAAGLLVWFPREEPRSHTLTHSELARYAMNRND